MKKLLLMCGVALSLSLPAMAQDSSGDAHMHHDMGHTASAKTTGASDAEYMAAHEKMMKDMAIAPTGDADKDFVAMMLPHHQGAVDMAKVELKHGKDPEIRKLAQDIVAAQEKEISFMKAWQEKHK